MEVSSRTKRPVNRSERLTVPAPTRPPKATPLAAFSGRSTRRESARSGAGAALDGAVGTIGIDVERASRALHHFARDHDLLDAFQARQIEHGLEKDAFEDRPEAARARAGGGRVGEG